MSADGAAPAAATTGTLLPDDRPTNPAFAHLRNQRPSYSPDCSSPASSMNRRDSSMRANSFRTDSSSAEGRSFSFKTTTEDLLDPKAPGDDTEHKVETSLWYSVPLLLAIVPATGGLAFKGGSVFLTDLSLLILTAVYLNWCLVTPWTWYESARSVSVVTKPSLDIAVEDPVEEEDGAGGDPAQTSKQTTDEDLKKIPGDPSDTKEIKDAVGELHWHEASALALLFIGPLAGAYILHIVRGSLADIGHQMISNVHLTLFALGAEIRPLRHAFKLVHARTLFLQRIVRETPQMADKHDNSEALQELARRVEEVEIHVADLPLHARSIPTASFGADNSEQVKKIQTTLQTQIDALNRAVRRYEKRATAQTMQTEARLQDLETRLRDALSLAAIAANYRQEPGMVSVAREIPGRIIVVPVNALKSVCMYPLFLLNKVTMKLMVFSGLAVDQPNRAGGSLEKSPYYVKSGGGIRESPSSRKIKF